MRDSLCACRGDECVSSRSAGCVCIRSKPQAAGNQGTCRVGMRIQAEVSEGQRSCVDARGICKRTCESRVSCACICAFTSDLQSLPDEEEEGTWLSVLVFCVSSVCSCC